MSQCTLDFVSSLTLPPVCHEHFDLHLCSVASLPPCSFTHLLCTLCCSSSLPGRSLQCLQSPAPAPWHQTPTPAVHPPPKKHISKHVNTWYNMWYTQSSHKHLKCLRNSRTLRQDSRRSLCVAQMAVE